jgi:ABC-type Fe3+-hydroxamate transport system substrate-binding protein
VRVVSLVPSVTETLLAWGVEPVACTRFCEQPELTHVGGTKDPDIAAIAALTPDLVVLDEEENRREDHDALVSAGVPVHVTRVRSVADVEPTLAALHAALQPVVSGELFAWNNITCGSTQTLAGAGPAQRRVFVPIWRRPWMSLNGDTYGSSLLAALGLTNVLAGHDDRYPTVELADVAVLRPDLVLAPTEPYPFKDRHLDELREVTADVRLVDGQDLFWWGVRTPGALGRLGQVLKAENPT